MSAYVVSDSTINAIVTYAASIDARYFWQGESCPIELHEQHVAGLLYTANVESVNHRYREDDPSDGFEFKAYTKPLAPKRELVPVHVLSLINCLEYQSCELPQWETTIAKAILTGIREAAIRRLPGMDNAPWGINDD